MKVRWSREEEFSRAYVRPAAVIDVRSGAGADGTLTAWEFLNVNSGAAGDPLPVRDPEPAHRLPARRLAAAPGLLPRARRDRQPLRPRVAHRRARASRSASTRSSCGCATSTTSGSPPCSAPPRNAPGWHEQPQPGPAAARDRVRESRRTAASPRAPRCASRAATGASTSRASSPPSSAARSSTPTTSTNQIEGATVMGLGGALFEAGPLRAPAASSTASLLAVPRSALHRRAADRGRPARPPRPPVRRRRRDADRRRRSRPRERDLRRHRRRGSARCRSLPDGTVR